eukprot:2148453-Rhodomonas_salina.1
MSGTDLAYAAMRCPVLTYRMLLCDVRYWHSVCCYVMSGTDVAYLPPGLEGLAAEARERGREGEREGGRSLHVMIETLLRQLQNMMEEVTAPVSAYTRAM